MTRGNINFIDGVTPDDNESKGVTYFYHNGDQYPTGMRDCFNVKELCKEEITKERFIEWAKKNYDPERITIEEIDQPKIFYTWKFITDYSYVFEKNSVKVWEWENCIFTGSREEFIEWIDNQK